MKTRYFKNNNMPVPRSLRGRTDKELGRETYEVERHEAGSRLATTPKDEKALKAADFQNARSRFRGENDALSAGL